tara:strand:+ start:290 stop:604 length:315 start_codon:yes stop_codon:yes gene_type:complete
MDDAEYIDLLSLGTLQAYLSSINSQYINHYIYNTVDTLLEAFYYLTMTFSRRIHNEIHCEAVTYWGEVYRATGNNHLIAGCRAIYKALMNIDGRVELDYYQRYL